MPSPNRPRFWQVFFRSLRLRCPVCGRGKAFLSYFKMHMDCCECGTHFERAPGYFLGSIYFNYGLTALLVTIGYVSMMFLSDLTETTQLGIAAGFTVLFPMWFFRYARCLWMGMDQYFDPVEIGEASSEPSASESD